MPISYFAGSCFTPFRPSDVLREFLVHLRGFTCFSVNLNLLACFIFVCELGCASLARAGVEVDFSDRKSITEAYIKIAFSPSRQTLRKFADNPVSVKYTCFAMPDDDCNSIGEAKSEAIETGPIFHLDDKRRPASVEFQFVPPDKIQQVAEFDLKEHAAGFSDTSDPSCQVFYSLKGSEITDAKILIAGRQPPLRTRICIMVNLFKAMGLNMRGDSDLAEEWNEQPFGLKDISEPIFRDARDQYYVFESIHFCAQLKPGMAVEEVRTSLLSDDACLSSLVGAQK